MLDKNGAGFDPSVEDVPNSFEEAGLRMAEAIIKYKPNHVDSCEECGGECVLRMTTNDEQYYKCIECGDIS